jgi:hypothetical protein
LYVNGMMRPIEMGRGGIKKNDGRGEINHDLL